MKRNAWPSSDRSSHTIWITPCFNVSTAWRMPMHGSPFQFLALQPFNYQVVHRLGAQMAVADFLFHRSLESGGGGMWKHRCSQASVNGGWSQQEKMARFMHLRIIALMMCSLMQWTQGGIKGRREQSKERAEPRVCELKAKKLNCENKTHCVELTLSASRLLFPLLHPLGTSYKI